MCVYALCSVFAYVRMPVLHVCAYCTCMYVSVYPCTCVYERGQVTHVRTHAHMHGRREADRQGSIDGITLPVLNFLFRPDFDRLLWHAHRNASSTRGSGTPIGCRENHWSARRYQSRTSPRGSLADSWRCRISMLKVTRITSSSLNRRRPSKPRASGENKKHVQANRLGIPR